MKKNILIILSLLVCYSLAAGEIEDLRFIQGLYKDQNYNMAKEELETFLTKYPDSKYVKNMKFLLGMIHSKEKNYQQAIKILAPLYNNYERLSYESNLLFKLGELYFLTDKSDKSIEFLRKFLKHYPQDIKFSQANYYLSKIYLRNDDFTKAELYINNALNRKQSAKLIHQKVIVLIELDKSEKAHDLLQDALIDFPKNDYIYLSLIKFYNYKLRNNEYEIILNTDLSTVNEESPYYNDFATILIIANFENGNYDQILEINRKVIDLTEESQYYLALTYFQLEEYDLAQNVLDKLKKSVKPEIVSGTVFYSAKIARKTDNPEKALKLFDKFIDNNPDHKFIAEAYYQRGLIQFENNEFKQAESDFSKALDRNLKSELMRNADYLRCEAVYFQNRFEEASDFLKEFIDKYENGDLIDEALFKYGLIEYKENNIPEALVKFEKITEEYPKSSKCAQAYIYLGDIYKKGNQYDIAAKKYDQALEKGAEEGFIYSKLILLNLDANNIEKAQSYIDKIPSNSKYSFYKNFLRGNINFAQKKYASALAAFRVAKKYASDEEEELKVLYKIALSYYQLKDYNKAHSVYKKLASKSDNPDRFVYQSAISAFNAEKYHDAIDYFNQYLEKFPESGNYKKCLLGIADSYYNLEKYDKAIEEYKNIITSEFEIELVEDALNGIEWSSEISDKHVFLKITDQLLKEVTSSSIENTIYKRKLRYLHLKEKWNDFIEKYDTYSKISSKLKNDFDIKIMLADAKFYTGQYSEADDIFESLSQRKFDPQIYLNWSYLKLNQGDTLSAIQKLKKGTEKSRKSKLWLELISLEAKTKHMDFNEDYKKFLSFAELAEKEEAKIIKVKLLLENRKYREAETLINVLLQSNQKMIKAEAQYLKGKQLYLNQEYKESLKSLLRIRYNYPKLEKIKIKAEVLACYAYLKNNQRDKAVKLFDSIKNSLPDSKKEKILEAINAGVGE